MRQNFHQLRGRIALARGESALAAHELEAALRERVRPQAALANVDLLAAYGERETALAHLDLYSRLAQEEAAPRAGGRNRPPRPCAAGSPRRRRAPGR